MDEGSRFICEIELITLNCPGWTVLSLCNTYWITPATLGYVYPNNAVTQLCNESVWTCNKMWTEGPFVHAGSTGYADFTSLHIVYNHSTLEQIQKQDSLGSQARLTSLKCRQSRIFFCKYPMYPAFWIKFNTWQAILLRSVLRSSFRFQFLFYCIFIWFFLFVVSWCKTKRSEFLFTETYSPFDWPCSGIGIHTLM